MQNGIWRIVLPVLFTTALIVFLAALFVGVIRWAFGGRR